MARNVYWGSAALTYVATGPKSPSTATANIFNGLITSPSVFWPAVQWKDIVASAQTERRGGAGPVRGLLGGKASPAAFVRVPRVHPRGLLAERFTGQESLWFLLLWRRLGLRLLFQLLRLRELPLTDKRPAEKFTRPG